VKTTAYPFVGTGRLQMVESTNKMISDVMSTLRSSGSKQQMAINDMD
jgi:hypothetical protein